MFPQGKLNGQDIHKTDLPQCSTYEINGKKPPVGVPQIFRLHKLRSSVQALDHWNILVCSHMSMTYLIMTINS